jgi:Flp pilus assembly pilin Flp
MTWGYVSPDSRHRGGQQTMRSIARFFTDDEAATAVEYSVMLALILLVTFSAIGMVGGKTSGLWDMIVGSVRSSGM